jgi:DNA-binding helix-hairpin-helix protein with protein kinase domain
MFSFIKNILHPAPRAYSASAFVSSKPAMTAALASPRIHAVADDKGRPIQLGGILAHGGEGTIHRFANREDLLVKIYHAQILADPDRKSRLRQKVQEMTESTVLKKNDHVAWPLASLTSEHNGEWCGYAMRMRSGSSLRELCGNPRNFGLTVPNWHRQHLIRLCLDFLDTITVLANNHTLPVDFNPSNFLVDPATIRLNFIDCDGYQFHGPSGIHLSEAILPEMAAPEVVTRGNWTDAPVSNPSLRFSVGMILFYILNLGNSPYRHRNGHDPVQNLISGSCALGRGADCALPAGSCYLIWSHLIYDLKDLFIRCFREGHSNPAVRPSVQEWRDALLKYNRCLLQGHAEASVMPLRNKSADFRGNSNS